MAVRTILCLVNIRYEIDLADSFCAFVLVDRQRISYPHLLISVRPFVIDRSVVPVHVVVAPVLLDSFIAMLGEIGLS